MFSRRISILSCAVAVIGVVQLAAIGHECCLNMRRPACGKVCKLVCETKKITAIGYGNECKNICVPPPSCEGCKHCTVCCGECKCEPCQCCQSSAPRCEFCWHDWFACGCGQPRSVKVLTKWQAEKKICWYHWEVVDAASCCDCVSEAASPPDPNKEGVAADTECPHPFYKPAPEGCEIGDKLPVEKDEWVTLAAVMTPQEREESAQQIAACSATQIGPNGEPPAGDPIQFKHEPESRSLSERLAQLFKK